MLLFINRHDNHVRTPLTMTWESNFMFIQNDIYCCLKHHYLHDNMYLVVNGEYVYKLTTGYTNCHGFE